jgi:extracellular factor (EF) 3-hydroxypalmitic acid methyl ester biosynthesis protein
MDAGAATGRFLPFLRRAEEDALLHAAGTNVFRPEELVVDQNESMRTIFLIEDGSVRVEREDEGQMIPLAFLDAGEFFGEMSFVDGGATSARVVAQEPTRLRMIGEANVASFVRDDPSFAGRLYRSIAAILVERLRRTSMHLSLENRQL